MSALLQVKDISVAYDEVLVVRGLSLDIARGEMGCLLGSSGCGKTTSLRAIAGFEPLCGGQILIEQELVSQVQRTLAPERRRVGMVFQDHALFPHLNVDGNIGFGLPTLSTQQRTQRVGEMLEVVGLQGLGSRYIHELSGGQQQRVALARALAPRPSVMLLDEPFSSLDADLRERLASDVRDILRDLDITGLLVTHDQNEAFSIADQVGVMHEGCLLQWDSAYNLYHQPVVRQVADFIGQGVFLAGSLVDQHSVSTELGILSGRRVEQFQQAPIRAGVAVEVLLRPDDIVFDANSEIRALVASSTFKGANFMYRLTLPSGISVLSVRPSHEYLLVGETVGIRVDADHLVVFEAD